jgi:hypothetical protein
MATTGLALAPLARLAGAETEFWEQKDPAQWTPEEINRLLTKSPWAREVSGAMGAGRGESGDSGGHARIPLGQLGSIPLPRRLGRSAGPKRAGSIRWESAAPILAAAKTRLPPDFMGHYVIGVKGFPLPEDRLDDLKQFAVMTPKGRELAQAGIVHLAEGAEDLLLFGFEADILQITRRDHEVEFAVRIGSATLKASFRPKEMDYRGELAI